MAESAACRTLLVGLGSPHGDDQAGWLVAGELSRLDPSIRALALASPADLLDHLDGLDCLLVCDACHSGTTPGTIHTWRWPAPQLAEARFAGTHDLSLSAVLNIAQSLGRLPGHVVIFGIEAERCEAGACSSARLHSVAARLAAAIHVQFGGAG